MNDTNDDEKYTSAPIENENVGGFHLVKTSGDSPAAVLEQKQDLNVVNLVLPERSNTEIKIEEKPRTYSREEQEAINDDGSIGHKEVGTHNSSFEALQQSIRELEKGEALLRQRELEVKIRTEKLLAKEEALQERESKVNNAIQIIHQERERLKHKNAELDQLKQQLGQQAQETKPAAPEPERDQELWECVELNDYLEVPFNADDQAFAKFVEQNADAESVSLSCCLNIDDFSPLAKFHKLKRLKLSNTNFNDLKSLIHNKDLEVLDLRCCSKLENDLHLLGELQQMRKINFWGNSKLSKIDFLKEMSNLRFLDLDMTNVSNPEAIGHLSKLSFLCISGTQIQDISFMSKLSNLRCLVANELHGPDNRELVSNFTAIKELKSLVFLAMSEIFLPSFSYFSEMHGLKHLICKKNRVTEITPLKDCHELQIFDCAGNPFANLNELAEMPHLKKVRISGLQIDNLSCINNCNELVEIDISENKAIRDTSFLKGKTKLEELYIQFCERIADISYLRDAAQTINILNISGCCGIKNIAVVGCLTKLTQLTMGKNAFTPAFVTTLERCGGMYGLSAPKAYPFDKYGTLLGIKRKAMNHARKGDFDTFFESKNT